MSETDLEARIEDLEGRVEEAERKMGVREGGRRIERDLDQRNRAVGVKQIIGLIETHCDSPAPIIRVLKVAELVGIERDRAEDEIEILRQRGEVYEPETDHLRRT